jgi:hypothetical protein
MSRQHNPEPDRLTDEAILPRPAETVDKLETLPAKLANPRQNHIVSLNLTFSMGVPLRGERFCRLAGLLAAHTKNWSAER